MTVHVQCGSAIIRLLICSARSPCLGGCFGLSASHLIAIPAFKARQTLCGVSMGALSLIVGAVACVPGALAIALRGRVPVGEWLLLLS